MRGMPMCQHDNGEVDPLEEACCGLQIEMEHFGNRLHYWCVAINVGLLLFGFLLFGL